MEWAQVEGRSFPWRAVQQKQDIASLSSLFHTRGSGPTFSGASRPDLFPTLPGASSVAVTGIAITGNMETKEIPDFFVGWAARNNYHPPIFHLQQFCRKGAEDRITLIFRVTLIKYQRGLGQKTKLKITFCKWMLYLKMNTSGLDR